jgi:hypothetical protein
MRKKMINLLFFIVLLTPIACALAVVNQRDAQRTEQFSLSYEGKNLVMERVKFILWGDVDNTGEKKLGIGIARYKFPIWSRKRDINFEYFGEITSDLLAESEPKGDLYLAIYKLQAGNCKKVKEVKLVSEEWLYELNALMGDFNGDGLNEIFISYWAGNAPFCRVYLLKGNSLRQIFSGVEDRAKIEIKDIDGDGKWEILFKAPTWHLATGEEIERLKGHILAIRIYHWNAKKQTWTPWRIIPDREGEREISREDLFRTPGADLILKGIPKSKLQEIYPKAFGGRR